MNRMKKIYLHFTLVLSMALYIVFAVRVKDANAGSKSVRHMDSMEIHVEGANVKLKKGKADTVETKFYGAASDAVYRLTTKKDGKKYKLSLHYTGKGMAPTVQEGGAVIKIPDGISHVSINGKSAAIVLHNMDMDTDIVTKGCAVDINNKKAAVKFTWNPQGMRWI